MPDEAAPGSMADDDAVLASIGMRLDGPGMGDLKAACARIAHRIHDNRIRVVGFVPSNDKVAVPPVIIHLGLALCDLTGATVAVQATGTSAPGWPSYTARKGADPVPPMPNRALWFAVAT